MEKIPERQLFTKDITRRDLFAAMAMQGLLSNLAGLRSEGIDGPDEIAQAAADQADRLITALDAP